MKWRGKAWFKGSFTKIIQKNQTKKTNIKKTTNKKILTYLQRYLPREVHSSEFEIDLQHSEISVCSEVNEI